MIGLKGARFRCLGCSIVAPWRLSPPKRIGKKGFVSDGRIVGDRAAMVDFILPNNKLDFEGKMDFVFHAGFFFFFLRFQARRWGGGRSNAGLVRAN